MQVPLGCMTGVLLEPRLNEAALRRTLRVR
jgi:hypothetical protein